MFRARAHGSHSKNDSLLKPGYNTSYIMSPAVNFKLKSSKSLQIGSQTRAKSLLAMTLNKNSALVNLNNRSQFNTNTASAKYHPNAHSKSPTNNSSWGSNNHDRIQNPKTFNPSKQWMDAMLKDATTNTSVHKYKSRSKAISSKKKNQQPQQNNNGTLTVNNHTFTGIWAKTLPKQQPVFPDMDDNDDEDQESKYDETNDNDNKSSKKKKKKGTKKPPTINRKNTIHSMFEQKQSQQANNIYAYSVAPKYSVKEMDAINNSTQ